MLIIALYKVKHGWIISYELRNHWYYLFPLGRDFVYCWLLSFVPTLQVDKCVRIRYICVLSASNIWT
jgi:hypothetical protein